MILPTAQKRIGKARDSFRWFLILLLISAGGVRGAASLPLIVQLPVSSIIPAFTYSPSSPETGDSVSFDGSSSICAALPCSYQWTDDANGTLLGTGATMSYIFQHAGT